MDNIFPNYNNTETCTIEKFANAIKSMPHGDLLEFGVAQADTTVKIASNNSEKKLFAFDHFKGLEQTKKPTPAYSGWVEGAFRIGDPSCPWIPTTVDDVIKKLKPYPNVILNIEDVHLLKDPIYYGIQKVVAVNIDVDIYEPTVSCLNFIDKCDWDKLYIRFDDWHGHEPDFDHHERLACKEWLDKNKQYKYSIPENGHAGGVLVWR